MANFDFFFCLNYILLIWIGICIFLLFKKKDNAICETNNKKASLYTGLSLHQSVEASCGGVCGSRVTNEQQGGQGRGAERRKLQTRNHGNDCRSVQWVRARDGCRSYFLLIISSDRFFHTFLKWGKSGREAGSPLPRTQVHKPWPKLTVPPHLLHNQRAAVSFPFELPAELILKGGLDATKHRALVDPIQRRSVYGELWTPDSRDKGRKRSPLETETRKIQYMVDENSHLPK